MPSYILRMNLMFHYRQLLEKHGAQLGKKLYGRLPATGDLFQQFLRLAVLVT